MRSFDLVSNDGRELRPLWLLLERGSGLGGESEVEVKLCLHTVTACSFPRCNFSHHLSCMMHKTAHWVVLGRCRWIIFCGTLRELSWLGWSKSNCPSFTSSKTLYFLFSNPKDEIIIIINICDSYSILCK